MSSLSTGIVGEAASKILPLAIYVFSRKYCQLLLSPTLAMQYRTEKESASYHEPSIYTYIRYIYIYYTLLIFKVYSYIHFRICLTSTRQIIPTTFKQPSFTLSIPNEKTKSPPTCYLRFFFTNIFPPQKKIQVMILCPKPNEFVCVCVCFQTKHVCLVGFLRCFTQQPSPTNHFEPTNRLGDSW